MPKREFTKEDLSETRCGFPPEGWRLVYDKITSTGRWSIHHEMVFQADDGKFYSTFYSVGATEMQDEGPWEYDPDPVECTEVEPVEVTVIEYHAVKDETE